MYTHTSNENGDRNENKSGGAGVARRNRILIPRDIKGDVKSTAFRRADVIVRSQIAKSAF